MAEKLQSTVRLFADDTIAYLAVDSRCDAMALQHDLDLLAEWEQTWQMEFHPDKCQVLWVTNKHPQNITPHDYILHGHTLSVVDDVKYLGLTVLSNLRWDTQIAKATAKANSTMAVLRRNVLVSSKAIKSTAYSALVRPHVEYCSAVWDSYTKKQTRRVEMVQRRAARWVCGKIKERTQLHWTNRNDKPPRLAQSRGAEESSTFDLVIQDGQQFGPDINKVPAHPRSSQYKGHASTCLHAHVPHPEATLPIQQLFTPDCDRLEWPSQPDSCCFITWGFQSIRDEAPCLDPADLFLTHFSFPFSTAYSFTFIYPNTLLLSVLALLPRRWALISLLVSALSILHFPILVLHISLLIALISSHTFSTIHHTSSIVSKLTFRHYHLSLNLNLRDIPRMATPITVSITPMISGVPAVCINDHLIRGHSFLWPCNWFKTWIHILP